MKYGRSACLFVLLLVACSESESGKLPPLSREELLNPETCKSCHINHYNEWAASMHAYASKDPVFRAMNKRGQEEAGLGDFCVKCHAPMALVENEIQDFGDLTTVPEHLQGVTCYFCHNAISVGEPHNNANIQLANDTIMRGALANPVDPGVHGVLQEKSPFHDRRKQESAIMCGACHDIVTPNGTHLERTLAEWKSSLFSNPKPDVFQSCSDCHMTEEKFDREAAPGFEGVGGRTNHSHLFPAVDVALTPDMPNQAALRSAIESCELQGASISYFEVLEGGASSRWSPGDPYGFTVLLETQAAHAMPSGAANDRRLWLEVIAIDKGGQEYWWSGRIEDNEAEEGPGVNTDEDATQLCMFRARFNKANGEPAHMFWDAAGEPGGKVLPPPTTATSGGHTAQCSYTIARGPAAPPEKLKLRLRMRPMGFDVLQDLVDSGHLDPNIMAAMPTFTFYEAEATLDPATRTWRVHVLKDADCDTWKCMMDDSSPECLASRAASMATSSTSQPASTSP